MDVRPIIEDYIAARDRFVVRIGTITGRLNEWTEKHRTTPPTLTEVAHFEGLRAARSVLLSEFTEIEDQLVVKLLQELSGAPPQTDAGDASEDRAPC